MLLCGYTTLPFSFRGQCNVLLSMPTRHTYFIIFTSISCVYLRHSRQRNGNVTAKTFDLLIIEKTLRRIWYQLNELNLHSCNQQTVWAQFRVHLYVINNSYSITKVFSSTRAIQHYIKQCAINIKYVYNHSCI